MIWFEALFEMQVGSQDVLGDVDASPLNHTSDNDYEYPTTEDQMVCRFQQTFVFAGFQQLLMLEKKIKYFSEGARIMKTKEGFPLGFEAR